MTSLDEYRALVNTKISATLRPPDWLIPSAKDFFADFVQPAVALLTLGKRTRAAFLAAGWQLFATPKEASSPTHLQLPITAGAALELYQASALIHDDIIDAADSRRGLPAAHLAFAALHQSHDLDGSEKKFGTNSAILLGDYLLSLAAHTFESAEAANLAALQRARELYHSMTAEVAFGQYLDNQAEFMPFTTDFTAQIEHSFQVLYHKSARYSVDCPLKIGAALAGASTAQIAQLSRIGKPLGEAFQLRDDYLGVFGSAAHTGKPAGGDLCEGKRTVLIGMTRKLLSKSDREFLDAHLGFPLSDSEISKIQQLIANSGALQAHEALIYEREAQAAQAVAELHTTSPILHELLTLLTNRKA